MGVFGGKTQLNVALCIWMLVVGGLEVRALSPALNPMRWSSQSCMNKHSTGPTSVVATSATSLYSAAEENTEEEGDDGRIDVSLDDRLYRIRIPRAPGIEWGTDLSFSFVYVREMDPSGPAAISGQIDKNDQLCELIAVTTDGSKPEAVNLLGASFDAVMTSFATLDKTVREVDLVFFKGTKDELKAVCTGEDGEDVSDDITVTVIQDKGSPQEKTVKLQAQAGVNVRELLINNDINVYQSVTRWTNCKGKQLCGST